MKWKYLIVLHLVFVASAYTNVRQWMAKHDSEIIIKYKTKVVEKDVIKYIRTNTTIPAEIRERIIEVVSECKESCKETPSLVPLGLSIFRNYSRPYLRNIALQGGYSSGLDGGVDIQVFGLGRWGVNGGFLFERFGPTATISYRLDRLPLINNLEGSLGVHLPLGQMKTVPYLGVRLPF